MSNYQTRLNMAAAACDLKPEEFRAFNFLAEYMDGFVSDIYDIPRILPIADDVSA